MTYSMQINKTQRMVFSDSNFKPYRKKPTISIYDAELNIEQKIASFNSQEVFEWFIREIIQPLVKEGDTDEVNN